MKRIAFLIPAIASACLLSGCATIANGRYQRVSLHSNPEGATCVASNDKGRWTVTTPANLEVHRSLNNLTVACNKPGFVPETESIPSHAKKMIAGNLLFGGFVGAGVDSIDGAGFSYPEKIDIPMHKPTNAIAASTITKTTRHKKITKNKHQATPNQQTTHKAA